MLEMLRHGPRQEEKAQVQAHAIEAQAAERLIISGSRIEDLQAAQARVTIAQGRLNAVLALLRELTLYAPQPAVVESIHVQPGDMLAPNAAAITLIQDRTLYARIYIPETQLGHVKVGDVVLLSVDAFADRLFRGEIEQIQSQGEYTPRNLQTVDERAHQLFAARVRVKNEEGLLRAGMAVLAKAER